MFPWQDPATSTSRIARLQICTSFIRIAKAADTSVLPHMKVNLISPSSPLRTSTKQGTYSYSDLKAGKLPCDLISLFALIYGYILETTFRQIFLSGCFFLLKFQSEVSSLFIWFKLKQHNQYCWLMNLFCEARLFVISRL